MKWSDIQKKQADKLIKLIQLIWPEFPVIVKESSDPNVLKIELKGTENSIITWEYEDKDRDIYKFVVDNYNFEFIWNDEVQRWLPSSPKMINIIMDEVCFLARNIIMENGYKLNYTVEALKRIYGNDNVKIMNINNDDSDLIDIGIVDRNYKILIHCINNNGRIEFVNLDLEFTGMNYNNINEFIKQLQTRKQLMLTNIIALVSSLPKFSDMKLISPNMLKLVKNDGSEMVFIWGEKNGEWKAFPVNDKI